MVGNCVECGKIEKKEMGVVHWETVLGELIIPVCGKNVKKIKDANNTVQKS